MELEVAIFSLPAALEHSLTLVREREASSHAIALSLEVRHREGMYGDESQRTQDQAP